MVRILVSVIIVNYNGKEFLKIAIDSLKKSIFKNFEAIVLDNASSDGSQNFIKKNYPEIKLVENNANFGYSGINHAIKYCNGKYILFLNNDIKLEKNCIGNLVKIIESDNLIGMAAPKIVNYYNKKLLSGGTWLSKSFYNGHIKGDNASKSMIIPYLGVGLIRKTIVDKYGYLFDPDYFIYGEDVDLGLRIRLLAKKTIFVHDALLYHMHAKTTNKSGKASTTYLMERNLLTTFFKILSAKNIIFLLPYVLFVRFMAIIRDLLLLKINIAISRLNAMLFILTNFNSILKKRQETQKFRTVNDDYLFEVFSEKYLFKPKFLV